MNKKIKCKGPAVKPLKASKAGAARLKELKEYTPSRGRSISDEELNALVAKTIFNWKEVQPPKYDCDGPLPKQGVVLAPPDFNEGEFRGWPNRGIVPYGFFLKNHTNNLVDAMRIVEEMARRGFRFRVTAKPLKEGGLMYEAYFILHKPGVKNEKTAKSVNPARAICLAAVGFVAFKKRLAPQKLNCALK